MEKHYTLLKAAQLLGVTTQTLRNWDNAGKIRTIRTPGNQRRIPESEISKLLTPGVEEVALSPTKPNRLIPEVQEMPTIVIKNDEKYVLMCKDIPVYDIEESKILDEKLLPGCILKGTMSFSEWMNTRYSSETNFSSVRLMQNAFGRVDYEHAAYTTGALSLSDCYWIKRIGEEINFEDITPYIHKEWDGMEKEGIQNEYIWGSLSNLFINGKNDKLWIDSHSLIKYNSFNEFEIYSLCSALGLENITEAQKTDDGVLLGNFTSPELFYESMEQAGITDNDTDPRYLAVEKFKEQAVALFVVDYLVENNDRFPDDYGYLRNATTGEYISMAPYYNFDRVWSGDSIPLPENAVLNYRPYITNLCYHAIRTSSDFSYGSVIEKRARELLNI